MVITAAVGKLRTDNQPQKLSDAMKLSSIFVLSNNPDGLIHPKTDDIVKRVTRPPFQTRNNRQGQARERFKPGDCPNCGLGHPPNRCIAYNLTCFNCNKKGHINVFCREPSKERVTYDSTSKNNEAPASNTVTNQNTAEIAKAIHFAGMTNTTLQENNRAIGIDSMASVSIES